MSTDPRTLRALTLWLPKPPDNANGRGHYMRAVREKKAYWRELANRAALRHGIPQPLATPIARATIAVDWYYPDRRHRLDDDNAIRRLKPAIDWIVAQGYIAGDDPARLKWLGVTHCTGLTTPPLCTVRLTLTEF